MSRTRRGTRQRSSPWGGTRGPSARWNRASGPRNSAWNPGHGVNGFCSSRHTRHARREERGGLRLLFATEQGEKVTHGISPGRCASWSSTRVVMAPVIPAALVRACFNRQVGGGPSRLDAFHYRIRSGAMARTGPSLSRREVGTASEIRTIPGGGFAAPMIWCGRSARKKDGLTTRPHASLVQTGVHGG